MPPLMAPQPQLSAPSITPPSSTGGGGFLKILIAIVGGAFLIYIGILFYNYLRNRQGLAGISLTGDTSSGDQVPAPVEGKKKTTIPAGQAPAGSGINYGVQFWMYVNDWDYNFSREKHVLKRISGRTESPRITLHPTDNSLNVRVAIFPSNMSAGAAVPGASTTGDSFTCTVENIPLQSWFSVSVTVFQRNLDIFINGRLVKSCVLPGVPRPVGGDVIIGDDSNGFSGAICNVHTYPNMLTPEDAKSFFSKGTNCDAPSPTKKGVDKDSTFITLFGYTFRFSKLDKQGNEVSSYTF